LCCEKFPVFIPIIEAVIKKGIKRNKARDMGLSISLKIAAALHVRNGDELISPSRRTDLGQLC